MKKLVALVIGAGAVAMAQAPPTVVTQERIEIRRYRSSRVLRSRGSS